MRKEMRYAQDMWKELEELCNKNEGKLSKEKGK